MFLVLIKKLIKIELLRLGKNFADFMMKQVGHGHDNLFNQMNKNKSVEL